jgi:hypothetical protein
MKRLVIAAFFLVVASLPAYATTVINCYSYWDNRPYDDGYVDFCVESFGDLCIECVDVQAGTGCADDTICDPNRLHTKGVYKIRLSLPAQRTDRVQVAARRGHPSRSGHSGSIRPVSMRVARLNAGSLL